MSATCNLIYFALQGLLLSLHASHKSQRLSSANTRHPPLALPNKAPLLQPIIDLLQYQVFCDRIKVELDKMVSALLKAGIPSSLRFDAVGESGHQLVEHFAANETARRIGGEALLRIDVRQVAMWSTFLNIYLCFSKQGISSLDIPFAIISYSPFATGNAPNCVHPSAGAASFRRSRKVPSQSVVRSGFTGL